MSGTDLLQNSSVQPGPAHQPSKTDHEHGWVAVSRHATLDGLLVWARCSQCGAWRAHYARPDAAMEPLTRTLGGRE